jgi:hypothetical protein
LCYIVWILYFKCKVERSEPLMYMQYQKGTLVWFFLSLEYINDDSLIQNIKYISHALNLNNQINFKIDIMK